MIEKVNLNKNTVAHIKLLEYERVPSYEHIYSGLSLSDTTWSKSEPLAINHFNAYLCYNTIIIHKSNNEVEVILNEIKELQSEIDSLEDISYENGDYYDDKLFELTSKLYGKGKLVIISGCTD